MKKNFVFIVVIIMCLICVTSCNNHRQNIVAELMIAQDCRTNDIPDGWEYNDPLHRLIFFRYKLTNPTSDTLFIPLGVYQSIKCKSLLSITMPGDISFKPVLYDIICSGTKMDNTLCPGDTMFLSFVMADFVRNEKDSLTTMDITRLINILDIKFQIDSSDVALNRYRVPNLIFDNDTIKAKICRSDK